MRSRSLVLASVVAAVPVVACSDSNPAAVDAAVSVDAAAPTVMEVTCPASVPLTVDAPDGMSQYTFSPAQAAISVGAIVKFTMHASHNVVPNTVMGDPGLRVDFNQTKCLQFTKAGQFAFHCAPHSFTATITVQ